MFNKINQIPLLSLLLVLQFLSDDVASDIEPFPMSGFPMGSDGGGGVGPDGVLLGSVSASNSGGSGDGTTSNGFIWSPRQVVTKLGTVQGFIVRPPNGYGGVEVFLNLPYASPPEGSLRFMPPVSGSPWKGIRRSETPSPVCPQVLPNIRNESEALKMMPRGKLTYLRRLLPHLRNQSEDCLYLNLRVPLAVAEGRAQGKLPVLVFVHGDDYGYGGGHPYDPSMLVSQGNIIVVTMNYRLGILGFLNADADGHFKLPFNFALLDQIGALQWVQENVELFGGDRSRVTLMGHGKGAVCVNFLMISNAVPTGLLFHRVILSSGSALSPLTADLSKGPVLARKFAAKVKCPTEPSSTMLQCLRELPLRYFLESELWNLFGPTGDGIVVKHSLPSESVIMNRISHYPLILGVVRAEFLPSLNNHDATYGLESERRRELLKQFIRKHYSFHRNEILAGAIHEYTDWEKPAQHPLNVRDETIDALADAQVVAPLTKIGDLHAASSRSKAYFYVFDYQSKNSEYQQRLGCVHGEDLLYMFGVPLYFYENEFSGTVATSHVDDDQPNVLHTKPGDIIIAGKTASEQQQQQQLLLRKEKLRKRNERAGGLGFFAGNFTWYEVQLSATVMQLWANFIRTGNPNGDVKAQGKVAHVGGGGGGGGMGTGSAGASNTYQQQLQQLQQPKGRPQGKSRKVKDESEVKEDELLHLATGTGVTFSDNRLRLSRDNLAALAPTPLEQEQHQQLSFSQLQQQQLQQQQHHHHYHQPKPIFVEWPEYDSLDKKYLILDLRPRVRSRYRAHKLSFWLYLVPDYQKNNEGTSAVSIHHEISVYSMMPGQNLSKLSVIQPTIFASGLHDTAVGLSGSGSGRMRYNSSAAIDSGDSSGKKRDGGLISGSRNSNRPRGSNRNGMGATATAGDLEERQKQQDSAVLHVPSSSSNSNNDPLESTYGFHSYSTALSVTIAIGLSLVLLNVLTFCILRAHRQQQRQQQQRLLRQQSSTTNAQEKFPIPLTTSSVSCGSASASLKRRRDNNNASSSSGVSGVASGASGKVHAATADLATTTVFCEHYVNEEPNINNFNDLYSSSYLIEEDDECLPPLELPGEEDDEEIEIAVVTGTMAHASSSSQPDHHSINDMNYGKYGAKKHLSKTSLTMLERGFVPISPAPPSSGRTTVGNARNLGMGSLRNSNSGACHASCTPSSSFRQKRKTFAVPSSSNGCGSGGLNEFSMSDVMAEPVTNASSFSPQSTTTTTRSELFEIEKIPTAEELIEADGTNAIANNIVMATSNSNSSNGDSFSTVVFPPPPLPMESDFVTHQEPTGHFFQSEQETVIAEPIASTSTPSCQLSQQQHHHFHH